MLLQKRKKKDARIPSPYTFAKGYARVPSQGYDTYFFAVKDTIFSKKRSVPSKGYLRAYAQQMGYGCWNKERIRIPSQAIFVPTAREAKKYFFGIEGICKRFGIQGTGYVFLGYRVQGNIFLGYVSCEAFGVL